VGKAEVAKYMLSMWH